MKIKLEKCTILQLYYCMVQAERSIDKVLGNKWHDFLEFFQGVRADTIAQVVTSLQRILDDNGQPFFVPDKRTVQASYSGLSSMQHLFGKWIAKWKRHWAFPAPELCLMVVLLNRFLDLLDLPDKPELEMLIDLRRDLCFSSSNIKYRCYGLADWHSSIRIEHLYQSSWISPLTLDQFLGTEQKQTVIPTRVGA